MYVARLHILVDRAECRSGIGSAFAHARKSPEDHVLICGARAGRPMGTSHTGSCLLSGSRPETKLVLDVQDQVGPREVAMDHLSPLDVAFLHAEDEDRHASLAIASTAILDGPAPNQDAILAAVGGRLPLVPRYRQEDL